METRKFWFVWNENGRNPTYKHQTFDSAKIEAERLANLNPGQTFVVLESRAECRKNSVTWIQHSDLSEQLPF